MQDINDLRKSIDEIDAKIIELIGKRNELSRKVGLYKLERNIPVINNEREKEMLISLCQKARLHDIPTELVKEIYKLIIYSSRQIQEDLIKKADEKQN